MKISQWWKFHCSGKFRDMDWSPSLQLKMNVLAWGAMAPSLYSESVDTPHIEFIIESYKDTFIEMKRTITQPKLPGTWAAAGDVMVMISRGPASPLSRNCHLWSLILMYARIPPHVDTNNNNTGDGEWGPPGSAVAPWSVPCFSRVLVVSWATCNLHTS